jgi:hypothetical protein
MFREIVKIVIVLILVGGLSGELALILIKWLMHLVSIKKMDSAFLIHSLLILVLVAFGFFFYWIFQPYFVLENITDFAYLIFLEIIAIIIGHSLISLFKKEEENKEGKK